MHNAARGGYPLHYFFKIKLFNMKVERYESVEVLIPASGQQRIQFPDLPNLRNAKVTRIHVYNNSTVSPSPLTGQTVANDADLQQATVTLYEGDLQILYNIPVNSFQNFLTPTSSYPVLQEPLDLNGITISWTKSYVNTNIAWDVPNSVICFGIFYHF